MTMDTFPNVGLAKVRTHTHTRGSATLSERCRKWGEAVNSCDLCQRMFLQTATADCVPADLQRRLPDPRQRRHGNGLSVRGEDQPEHRRGQRGRSQRHLQITERQRGHVHPEVGQRRR